MFDLLQERIYNNDFSYIDEVKFKGRKEYNLLSIGIIRYFNLLCTGQTRKQRKQVKSSHLYTTIIKVVTVKSLSLPPQQQNAFVQKKIKVYERELKEVNRLVNNRKTVAQILFLLMDVTGFKNELTIKRENEVIDSIKTALIKLIYNIEDDSDCVAFFNSKYPKNYGNEIAVLDDLNNIFETDLSNSYFNQIDEQQAYNLGGEHGLNEFLKYHKLNITPVKEVVKIKEPPKYKLPEIDFD